MQRCRTAAGLFERDSLAFSCGKHLSPPAQSAVRNPADIHRTSSSPPPPVASSLPYATLAFALPGPSLPPPPELTDLAAPTTPSTLFVLPPSVPLWGGGSFVADHNLPILPCKLRHSDSAGLRGAHETTRASLRQSCARRNQAKNVDACYIQARHY